MNRKELAERIANKISDIPVHSGGYISCVQETLRQTIEMGLIVKIAEIAAEESISVLRAPAHIGDAPADRLADRLAAMMDDPNPKTLYGLHLYGSEMLATISALRAPAHIGDERAAFEDWANADNRRLEANECEERAPGNNHYYECESTNEAYIGWCARAALTGGE